jgi:hypothetical protein
MRRTFVCIGLLCLLFTTACDLDETVTSRFRDSLLPYFPNAKTLISGGTIMGLTCAQGVGDGLVEQVKIMVPQMPGFALLRTLGPIKYQYLAIGFPHSMIRYQLGSGTIDTYSPGAEYESAYRRDCGIEDSTPATYAYVGVWQVESTAPDGITKTSRWFDTLGIYGKEQDAIQHQESEAATRVPMIAASMEERGRTLVSATLVKVTRVPVTRSALVGQ